MDVLHPRENECGPVRLASHKAAGVGAVGTGLETSCNTTPTGLSSLCGFPVESPREVALASEVAPRPLPPSPARATAGALHLLRDNVPGELIALVRWVCWDGSLRDDGRLDKTPINALTGGNAQTNNRSTWGSFGQACALAMRDDRVGGLGLVLTDSEYWALDLDHVIDRATGEVAPAARTFLTRLAPTYTERSPSGDGLHVIYRGRRPAALTATKAKDAFGPGKHLEVFGGSSGRYLTMTGLVWEVS
jgi:hypothetical protein